jgi:hypothetical protein
VRRPHPPPTATVMADDFDRSTRGSPTVFTALRGPDGSELDIDYDDVTVAPALLLDVPPSPTVATERPNRAPGEPVLSPRLNMERGFHYATSPPQRSPSKALQPKRRNESPARSFDQLGFDDVSGLQFGVRGKAASVAGQPAHHRTPRLSQKPPLPPTHLVPRKVLEDGPERTITIWREGVAANSSHDEEPRSDVDSHAGRRRESVGSQGKPEAASTLPSSNIGRHHDRLVRKSIDLPLVRLILPLV